MKKTMLKVWGIVLTLAMLSGLLMMAVPVSAGNLTWDFATPPAATNSTFQLTENTQASLFAIAPDGKTMFAYNTLWTGATTAQPTSGLFKSSDGGVTWTNTNIGASLPAGVMLLAVSPTYATDTTVLAATSTTLYRSRDGGANFLAVLPYPAVLTGPIMAIDISPYYVSSGGTAMMIASTDDIALYSDDYGWRIITGPNFTIGPSAPNATNFVRGHILTAKFSPTYQSDGEIVAVVSGVLMGSMAGPGTVVETLFANSPWNVTVQPAQLTVNSTPNYFIANSSTATASVAFPSDYSSSSSSLNRVYVTIGDPAGFSAAGNNVSSSTGFDVWRINGSINSSQTLVNATQMRLTDATSPANNCSIAYTGTAASGTLVVGEYVSNSVWYNTTPNGGTVWTQASNGWGPSGKNVHLAFPAGSSTLYASTDNVTNNGRSWGSAIFTSKDYNAFWGISQINVPALSQIGLSQPTGPIAGSKDQFLMVSCNAAAPTQVKLGDVQMIFKSMDAGATWAEVFGYVDTSVGTPINISDPTTGYAVPNPATNVLGQALNGISTSPTYSTDQTLYVPQTHNTIWKSTDGGFTWNSLISTTPNNSVSGFGLIDANTYWLGSNQGGLYKSGSYTQIATLDGKMPFQIFNLPFGVLINTWTGELYLSTDNGATFTALGTAQQFGSANLGGPGGVSSYFNTRAGVAFDVGAKTIYAINCANNLSNIIYRWVVGTDTAWLNWTNLADMGSITFTTPTNGFFNPVASALVRAGDGTFYIRVPNTTSGTAAGLTPQIVRCVDMATAPQGQQTFAAMPQTDGTNSDFNNATNNLPGGKSTWVVTDSTAQTNTVYQIVTNQQTTTQTGYSVVIKAFIDTLTGKVTTTAPTAKQQIPNAFTFSWKTVTSPQQVTYQVEIATDDQFNGTVQLPTGGPNNVAGQTTANSMYVTSLVPGQQYYLRVATVLPLPSKWSDTVPFVVKLGEQSQSLEGPSGNRISPLPGSTGVPVNPTFQWAAVAGADSYHIQVADNPGFTSPLADATTKDTFFVLSSALKPGTIYYWRVQAVSGTTASDYVSNVFTTAAPVTAAPPPATSAAPPQTIQPTIIVTVPPQTAPPTPTPAYIWVIIAIGAVLVIAVVVLIARTRRT